MNCLFVIFRMLELLFILRCQTDFLIYLMRNMSSPDESVAPMILSGSNPRPNPLGFSSSPRNFFIAVIWFENSFKLKIFRKKIWIKLCLWNTPGMLRYCCLTNLECYGYIWIMGCKNKVWPGSLFLEIEEKWIEINKRIILVLVRIKVWAKWSLF